ncbi:hypothetical protein BJF79_39175 [Actinomadura sp. CNU-125]|nr:hypothetical protein BJF79_39175 [Actinomadura sp. CNU-125]
MDAAVAVLAEQGSRGLTHRAVDAAADVPPGTTSRYFRTRGALLDGVVERLTHRLKAHIDAHPVHPVSPAELEDVLVAVLTGMLTDGRHDPIALFELHLESTRDADLRRTLTGALRDRADLLVRHCGAAGLGIGHDEAMLLEMSVLGIVFTALTTGVPESPVLPIRTAVRALLARHRAPS